MVLHLLTAEFYSKNKFEKLVHLVGFITRGSLAGKEIHSLLWNLKVHHRVCGARHLS